MQMKEKLDKIEFILEHLREPERLLEEEFVNWLQEEENKHVFNEVITNRMAFLEKEYGQQVEPEQEWQNYGSKCKRIFILLPRIKEKSTEEYGIPWQQEYAC